MQTCARKGCSNTFEPSTGRGRPQRFCGSPCRRAADFAIRRANRAIEYAEDKLLWYRSPSFGGNEDGRATQIAFWSDECDRLNAELLEMLR